MLQVPVAKLERDLWSAIAEIKVKMKRGIAF